MKIQGVGNIPSQQIKVDKPAQNDSGVQAAQQRPEAIVNDSALPEDDRMDEEIIDKAVEQANNTLKIYNRYIERDVHETTHAIMYKVKDIKTNEVIAEFPPKKIQDMIAKMWELAGLFVDEKA